jgi:Mannosyltransferase (PIG-V)
MSAAEPAAPRQEIWRTLLLILALYTISRAVFAAIGLLSHYTIGDGRDESLASLLCRWDCHWYLGLIEQGYTTASETGGPGKTSYAFFPVYPLLARALTTLGMTPLVAALWLANLAFIAALFYVQRYARLVGLSRQASLIAVALLCLVPHGFVFSAVYTESLFLLLLVAAMYHLRRGDYLVAGLAAALLSGVRANGIFFIVFALVFIVREFGWRSLVMPWQRPQVYVPVVLAPLGLFLFWAWCFYTVGDAFAQMSSVEQGWHWRSDLPWRNLIRHLGGNATERFWVLCSLAIGALSLLLLRARLYAEFALCAAILCLLWSGQIANSLLRYSMVLFPVWLGLARELDKRPLALAAVIGVFGLFNGWLLVAWTLGALVSI